MPLSSRLRRALGRSSPDSTRSSSTSSSSSNSATNLSNTLTTTPSNLPTITLTKTSSRLSKITSWRTSKEKKWVEPKSKYPHGGRNEKHIEMLKGFEMKFGRTGMRSGVRGSLDGGWSVWSGVSPMASRCASIDEGRRRSGEERGEKEEVEVVEEE